MSSIDCRRFEYHVHPLSSGEVDGALAMALSFHAARCIDCEARLHSARRVTAFLDTAAEQEVEPPETLVSTIMSALPDARRFWTRRRLWGMGLTGGLAAGLGLALLPLLASWGGLAAGSPFTEIHMALSALASRLQQFGTVIETLVDRLPRLPAGPGGVPSGHTLLPGLALVTTGLLGTLTALYLTAAGGAARWRHR